MSDNDLYQEMILDHYKNPRNCHCIEHATNEADGQNPLCGDELTVQLILEDGLIKDIAFTGMGCAISQASASMMTDNLKGKPIDDAMKVYEKVHKMITGELEKLDPESNVSIGKLQVLEGVSEFPMRVKCASLAWHTMKAAIDSSDKPVSTEV
jgi:nitrogen fixation NifU-like protein